MEPEHGRAERTLAVIKRIARQEVVTDRPHVITLSPRDYDAVLFDLDGVLTLDGTSTCGGVDGPRAATRAS